MCGIAGFLSKSYRKSYDKNFLKISKDLSHRGPDSSNYYKYKNNLFIHTRLSIIDLEGGFQPIVNNDLVLVANGEIYNDSEIRAKFKKYNFKTRSDSESIMALYHKEGITGLKNLRGMYAFAIYDRKKNITILSRDIFGIKPLYFCQLEDSFIFCSEIQPMLNLNLIKKNISKKKLLEYFELQYCSGKKTIYENIFRVLPGEILVIEDGRLRKSIIQKLPQQTKKRKTIGQNFIEKKIKETISVHLRSEVPYCLFFSGGIDSMLILYFMSKIISKKKIEAYKVYIDDKSRDDNALLRKISKEYKIHFNEINFSENDFWKLIPFAAKHIDDPIADYAILPTFKLAEQASKNFKVAITGEGGDEIFGGYGRYRKLNLFKKKYFKGAFRKFKDFSKDYWSFETNQLFVENLDLTNLQKRQYFDYINWLPNDLLVKLDRCLMAYGMEGRTPLVDKKIFENFFFIKDKYKVKKGYGKYIIREFLNNRVPYYNAFEKKEGFSIPINSWIPKKAKILEEFLPKVEILHLFFTKDEIKNLCRSVEYKKKYVRCVWHLIFISAWYYVNFKNFKTDDNFFDIIRN